MDPEISAAAYTTSRSNQKGLKIWGRYEPWQGLPKYLKYLEVCLFATTSNPSNTGARRPAQQVLPTTDKVALHSSYNAYPLGRINSRNGLRSSPWSHSHAGLLPEADAAVDVDTPETCMPCPPPYHSSLLACNRHCRSFRRHDRTPLERGRQSRRGFVGMQD